MEKKIDLTVKIRKKYKEGLLKKWVYHKVGDYNHYEDCVLCKDFRDADIQTNCMNCKRCPFNRFKYKFFAGCGIWIKKVDPDFEMYIPTKKQFKHFINKAKKYIIFY